MGSGELWAAGTIREQGQAREFQARDRQFVENEGFTAGLWLEAGFPEEQWFVTRLHPWLLTGFSACFLLRPPWSHLEGSVATCG